MKIRPFDIEIWMNEFENHCAYNLAETCVASLTIEQLLSLSGKSETVLLELLPMKLTYGAIEGSERLRSSICQLYNNQQLENIITKLIEYESRKPTQISTVVPIWAGNANFGPTFDRMAASLLLSTVRQYAPHHLQPWILYGSPRSPFVGNPKKQPAIFNFWLKSSTGIACMIGHGNETGFFSMMYNGKVIVHQRSRQSGFHRENLRKRKPRSNYSRLPYRKIYR